LSPHISCMGCCGCFPMLTKWSREITLFVCSWFFARFDARFNDFEYLLLNTVPHTHSSNWVIAFAESPWLGVLASFSDRKVAIYKAISPLLCKCTQLFFFLMRLLVLGCISCRWVYTYSTYLQRFFGMCCIVPLRAIDRTAVGAGWYEMPCFLS